MATTLKSVLERVVGAIEDEGQTTWVLADLVRYANDGQIDLLTRRPDLFVQYIEHPLVLGWRQTIPANATKLVDVHGNLAGDRRACTKTTRSLLDAQVSGWRAFRPVDAPDHFMFDERDVKQFDVFPPATANARLAIECTRMPAPAPIPAAEVILATLTGNVDVPDDMAVALHHYVAFRCFNEGSEDGNAMAARTHLAIYADILGVDIKATLALAPKANKP